MKKLLTKDDITGVWAIMPTPSKPNASDWRETDTVDLVEAARIAEELVASGVNGILSMGSFGECATLTWEEKVAFVETVVKTVDGRVPFFCGTTSLNTRESIRQTREMKKLGADGTMLGVPMWCEADLPTAVQFYKDVAEACPDMAICAYANPPAFKFAFPRPFWAAMNDIEQVVCCKYLNIALLQVDLQLAPSVRFLTTEADYYAGSRIAPDEVTAFWSSGSMCGPAAPLALRDAVAEAKKTGDWSTAKEINNKIGAADRGFFPKGEFSEFVKYNIGLEKGRMDAAGWLKAGPVRPPYHIIPEDYLKGAQASGKAWAKLHKEYSK